MFFTKTKKELEAYKKFSQDVYEELLNIAKISMKASIKKGTIPVDSFNPLIEIINDGAKAGLVGSRRPSK